MQEIDNKEVALRLTQLIKDQRAKSVRAFALSVDCDPSFFAKILKGDKPMTEAIANSIGEKYGVNEDWLLRGEGDPYEKKEDAPGIEGVLLKINTNLEKLLQRQDDILDQHSYTRAEIRGVARYLVFQDSKDDAKAMEGLLDVYRKLVAGALRQDERTGTPADADN